MGHGFHVLYRSGVNELALPRELAADLDVCVGLPGLLGVMPTMAEGPEDLDRVHELVAERERARGVPVGSLRFVPLVETPGAVLNARAVARAPTAALAEGESADVRAAGVFRDALLCRAAEAQGEGRRIAPDPGFVTPLAEGDLVLHSFARPLGVSANLALSTLFLVTHPIHFDHARFDLGEGQGIVVSGGLVVALTVAASARDLHEVLWEELLSADNIRPVAPTDTVGALTYVVGRRELEAPVGFEELTLRTLGVRGVTPSEHLAGVAVPRALLAETISRPSDYDRICREAGATCLEGKIVTQVTRRVIRALPR
ncbi:uncharacterized protein SOCE26_038770 [Sorangium cellulosum]|uniref:Uncharacterized protein n=1 Tax=Sorangium cellulosum TaxID=56 RepID=A0A2L0ET44_SORCE|nr:hypothetical protein [Sorangium cellulosum]AUX42444.1 uncharacterized protein SOCE26_038770 [Sorangium cellulosum]